jgi:hypothetical protein
MYTVCSNTFQRENNKELTFPRVLLWPALFLMFTILCRDVACRMKRRGLRPNSPLPLLSTTILAGYLLLTACREEVSRL